MEANERAGQPAADADLVDVAALVTAYYAEHPDPDGHATTYEKSRSSSNGPTTASVWGSPKS